MTNLDKLNELLRNPAIHVPEHSRKVHDTGKNQQWLHKNLSKNPNIDPEIKRLLAMTMHELHKPYVG